MDDLGAGLGSLERVVDEGRPEEAAPRLRVLCEANPGSARAWAALARCCEALGDAEAEAAAVEALLAIDASRSVALRLARLRRKIGDRDGEQAAWRRVLEIDPASAGAHGSLADLLESAGRYAEAAPHLQRFLECRPGKTRAWSRLGRAWELAGDLAQARTAWARVAELDPANAEASERLAAIRIAEGVSRKARAPTGGLRLQVLGNCQAYVMGQCLRSLLPGAEIAASSWAELGSEADVQRLAASLEMFDVVIAQPPAAPELERFSPEALAEGGSRCILFPGVSFTGFHPDAVRVLREGLEALTGEWHSALIMAAWRMGLAPERTEALFNAYIYGRLGYFDEYAKASWFQLNAAAAIGWDLSTELPAWPQPFVHTPNHPKIAVMMDLARGVCARLGIEPAADAEAPPDPFSGLAWPIYPEIGKRLGVHGDMTFVSRRGEGRRFALDEAIAWCYRAYAKAPAAALAVRRVDEVIARLGAEGV